jgi:hypothetical protein
MLLGDLVRTALSNEGLDSPHTAEFYLGKEYAFWFANESALVINGGRAIPASAFEDRWRKTIAATEMNLRRCNSLRQEGIVVTPILFNSVPQVGRHVFLNSG